MLKSPLTIEADAITYDNNADKINVIFLPTNLILSGEIAHSAELSVKNTTPNLAIAAYIETARQEILKNLPEKFAGMFE